MNNRVFLINYNPWPSTPAYPPLPTSYSIPVSVYARGAPAAPMTPQQKANMESLLETRVAYVADMDRSGFISSGDIALSESWGAIDASMRLSQAMVNYINQGL